MNTNEAKANAQAVVESLGLTVEAVFVPVSRSRNKDNKDKSLNWTVTIKRNGRDVLATTYMAGIGHCPSYKQGRLTVLEAEAIDFEVEHGRKARLHGLGYVEGKEINPDPLDVLYSLASDADALDHGTFEDWADSYGYDSDSREAERIYKACLEIGLKLRAALGEDGLRQLREAFQGY